MKKNQKRYVIIFIVIIAILSIVIILINNKSKIEAKAKSVGFSSAVPVKVATVEKVKLDNSLTYVGTTYPNAEVPIISETQGKILNLFFDIGDYVTKGRLLVQTDTVLKYANYLNAQAAFDKAKADLQRYEKLYSGKSVNDAQLDQAKFAFKSAEAQLIIAKKQLMDTRIYAPVSGVITSRNIEAGTVISPGFSIGNIVDISNIKIKVNVAEKDVYQLSLNQKVIIETDVFDKKFEGHIKSINSKADEAHTYSVEIMMKNDQKYNLKAGMFAKIYFQINSDSTLVIPREALVGSVKSPQVYVVLGDSLAVLRNIVINRESDKFFGVAQGLNIGEKIVINGQINLKNNSKIYVQ